MKKLLLLFAIVVLAPFSVAQAQGNSEDSDEIAQANVSSMISFADSLHNFGDIKQGDKVSTTFKFTNTGTAPLILSNVATTCGCTAPDWARQPIAPGEEAMITINFNSAGKAGSQTKVITVYSNASNSPERIKILTNVLKP